MPIQYPDNAALLTGVMIIPPPEVQRLATPIMYEHYRFMLELNAAHLSLFIPFVPVDALPDACKTIAEVCRDIQPFPITLDGYGYWHNGMYLKLADEAPVIDLHRKLLARFPDYPPYGGKYGTDLDPHITLGYVDEGTDPATLNLPTFEPITFMVDRLNVLYGGEVSVPLITYDVIHLGK